MTAINLTFISGFLIILLIGCSASGVQDLLNFNKVANKFAWKLYKEAKNPSRNTFVSPITTQFLLATLLQGANGTTATEIASVLQHETDDKAILNAYKAFARDINKKKRSPFKAKVALVADESLPLLENFKLLVNDYFITHIERCNFKNNPTYCKDTINTSVDVYTSGKIKKLLRKGSIDSNTEMVMFSISVFEGLWKKTFDKKNTKIVPFYINPNVTVKVKMMGLTGGSFRYSWNSNVEAQIVELPYKEDGYRMIIILPDNLDLVQLEAKLTNENIFELINSLQETELDIFLPKFSIKDSTNLANILQKMGMLTALSENSDFSKMTNSSFSISNIVQKTKIVVSERGTKAVANSGIFLSAQALPLQLVCNSPFLFIILKRDTILYIGSFLKP